MNQLRMLVIEEDANQRELIVGCIENYFGHGTTLAVSTLADALQQPLGDFDLILSDYNLPDATGPEVLRQIGSASQTPVILVTGRNDAETAAEAIRHGAMDYLAKVGDYHFTIPLVVEKNLTVAKIKNENETLRRQLERALREVNEKNAQLEASLRRVEELAATDALTGLYNRRHFSHVSGQLFSEAYRYGKDLACIMLDMDGFKQVNDQFGHQAGDAVLMLAGKVIAVNLRRMDLAARYGGDEFVILLPQAGIDEARIVSQRILDDFRVAASLQWKDMRVSMSIGMASMEMVKPVTCEQLIAAADTAMYRAKQAGRDRVESAVAAQ